MHEHINVSVQLRPPHGCDLDLSPPPIVFSRLKMQLIDFYYMWAVVS
jgi:hypothetical protein